MPNDNDPRVSPVLASVNEIAPPLENQHLRCGGN